MSEHEVWNELGNLYYISGMLDQAAYAYNRSIKLHEHYGLPYSNLAYIKLQQGYLIDAADLYKQSIDLLATKRDKAISWYRLGDVFRRLKNYRDAIMAYQQADSLDAEVSKDLEGSHTFLYGPSSISVDTIPTIVDSSNKKGEETIEDGEIIVGVPTSEVVADDAGASSEDLVNESEEPIIRGLVDVSEVAAPEVPFQPENEPASEVETSASVSIIRDEEEMIIWEKADLIEEKHEKNYAIEADASLEKLASLDADDQGEFLLKNAEKYSVEVLNNIVSTSSDFSVFPQPATLTESSMKNSCLKEGNNIDVDVMVYEQRKDEDAYMFMAEETKVDEPKNINTGYGYNHKVILSETEKNIDDNDELISRLEQELNKNPRNAKKWNELASLYKASKLYEQCITANQQAVKLNSESPLYLYELGISYAFVGRHDEAIDCMQRVIELNPDHSLAHATLGGYYRKMGLEELADQHIGIAMKNYIDDENQYNRACLEALSGNVEQAVEFLRNALEARQIYVEWALRDPDLDSIRYTPQFKELIEEYAQ